MSGNAGIFIAFSLDGTTPVDGSTIYKNPTAYGWESITASNSPSARYKALSWQDGNVDTLFVYGGTDVRRNWEIFTDDSSVDYTSPTRTCANTVGMNIGSRLGSAVHNGHEAWIFSGETEDGTHADLWTTNNFYFTEGQTSGFRFVRMHVTDTTTGVSPSYSGTLLPGSRVDASLAGIYRSADSHTRLYVFGGKRASSDFLGSMFHIDAAFSIDTEITKNECHSGYDHYDVTNDAKATCLPLWAVNSYCSPATDFPKCNSDADDGVTREYSCDATTCKIDAATACAGDCKADLSVCAAGSAGSLYIAEIVGGVVGGLGALCCIICLVIVIVVLLLLLTSKRKQNRTVVAVTTEKE